MTEPKTVGTRWLDEDEFARLYRWLECPDATVNYDDADRITKITYPDGTSDQYTYDRLDLASYQDREHRLWTYTHDVDQWLTKIVDPAGQETLFAYNLINELTSLTDPKGNVTGWSYDVEGRLAQKTYADTSAC